MKKAVTFILLAGFFSLSQAGTKYKTISIKFETDSHCLDVANNLLLKNFLSTLDYTYDYTFIIDGHTDNRGSYAYNNALSARRVNTVHDALLKYGIEAAFITSGKHGEYEPMENNDMEEGRAANRRVDLIFSYSYFSDVNELLDSLGVQYTQKFIIDPGTDNLIEGRNGIKVLLPANSLVGDDGFTPAGNVEITLTEALDYQSYLANELATLSGDKMLESGGMLRLEAVSADGTSLSLDTNEPAIIALPTEAIVPGMQLFLSENGEDWNTTGDKIDEELIEIRRCVYPYLADFYVPKYKFDSTIMPRPPIKPVKPRIPHEPRPDGYEPVIHLDEILFTKKIKEEYAERYQNALQTYDEKMDLYDKRVDHYRRDSAQYLENLVDYRKELQVWELSEQQKADKYYQEMYPIYERKTGKYNANLITAYLQCDSLRKAEIESMAADLDKMNFNSDRNLKRYVFNVTNMGWINCDRFYDVPAYAKRNITAWDNDDSDEYVKLLFPGIRGMVPLFPESSSESYTSEQSFPKGIQGVVFAYKLRDGKPAVFFHKVDEQENVEMEFVTVKFTELRDLLQNANRVDGLNDMMLAFNSYARR